MTSCTSVLMCDIACVAARRHRVPTSDCHTECVEDDVSGGRVHQAVA